MTGRLTEHHDMPPYDVAILPAGICDGLTVCQQLRDLPVSYSIFYSPLFSVARQSELFVPISSLVVDSPLTVLHGSISSAQMPNPIFLVTCC